MDERPEELWEAAAENPPVAVPRGTFSLQVAHSLHPRDPESIDHRTEPLPFATTTASFRIRPADPGPSEAPAPAVVERLFHDILLGRLRIRNAYGIGVRVTIRHRGQPLVEEVLSPGSVLVLDLAALSRTDDKIPMLPGGLP